MAIAVIQEITNEAAGSATTITANITSTAGNTLVVFGITASTALTLICSDSVNGTYTVVPNTSLSDVTNGTQGAVFVLPGASNAGGALVVTLGNQTTSNSTFWGIWIIEFSGATGADGGNAAAQTAPPVTTDGLSSGTVSNANQPGMLVSVCYNDNGGGTTAATGTGFTSTTTAWTFGGPSGGRSEYQLISNTTGTPATFTAGSAIGHITMAVFIDQSGPSGPTITVQPQSVTAYTGQTATFNVSATGTGTIHYQWKMNGSNVGTDSSSYTTGVLTLSDNASTISVTLTDDNAPTNSNTVTLFVKLMVSVAWIKA
jgi:hypothetical protein